MRSRSVLAALAAAVLGLGPALVAGPAHAADSLLSQGKPVTASSTYSASYPASYAVDGNLTTTRWASVLFHDPEWIYVDLGRNATVGRVVLTWEAAHATAYQLQTSVNGTTWTDIYSTTTGDGGTDDVTGLSGLGRYVRMYGTQRGCTGCSQLWGYSLWEMQVYGTYLPNVKGGYYLSGNADITADTVGQGMNLKSMTAYRSLYDLNVFPGWNKTWINTLMSNNGVEPNFVLELKKYGGPPGSSITCNGTTYTIPASNMTTGFWGAGQGFYGYNQVTSGALDGLLCNASNQLNALPAGPVNVQVFCERDTDHQSGITMAGVGYTWVQADALAVPAAQYIIDYFRAHTTRATAPTFTAGMGGWNHDSFVRSYVSGVDYLQYNAYNHTAPSQTAYTIFNRTYAWLPELPAGSWGKRVIVAEYGTNSTFGDQAAWIQSVPAAVALLPRIRETNYFNSNPTWGTLDPKQAGLDALKTAYGQPPYV